MRNLGDLTKVSRRELVLHAVLLVRTVNKYMSKECDLELYENLTNEELIDYIEYFYDPQPETNWEEFCEEEVEYEEHYTPCATNRDYGPSNPWDAPGMSIHDFI